MNSFKKLFPKNALSLISAAALFLISGCASPFGKENRAYVYVAENETISCLGHTFRMSDELASFLVEEGATPDTVIIIVSQGAIPDFYLKSIVYACGHKGFTQVYIRGNLRANATVAEPGHPNAGQMRNGAFNGKREPPPAPRRK